MSENRDREPSPDTPDHVEDRLHGRLDDAAAEALLAHLEEGETRASVHDEETRLRELLAAPAGFVDEVMERVRAAPKPSRPLVRLPVGRLASAAALLLAATLAFLYLTDGTDYSTPPEPPAPVADVEPDRAQDLARRARLFLAAAAQAPVETLGAELEMAGLDFGSTDVDLASLDPDDREAVRRVMLLGEAYRNDAPVARAEIAMLTEGLR